MTVYVAEVHVQRLVLVVKMAIVLKECTTENRRSLVPFCAVKINNNNNIGRTHQANYTSERTITFYT
jgi:hypothetical protein